MLLVIYFDVFRINLVKRLKENNIKYDIVKYSDLENYLQTDSAPTKVIVTGSKNRILRENDFPILKSHTCKLVEGVNLLEVICVNLLNLGFLYLKN